ncbi:sulfotransferase family protein [Gammaproteobacteria bacterium]|nr:sulfotransferase family protein [Gammaproteobacteria bacterium]
MSEVTFIRIPKNASTSLYTLFGESNSIRNEYLDSNNRRYLGIFESSHCEIDYAVNKLGSNILDKPVVAVVRNPYDRLVSMYFFAKKYKLGKLYNIDLSTFDRFAIGFYEHSDDEDFFHAFPQVKFIGEEDVSILRFENLQNDLEQFIQENSMDKIDVKQLKKLNSTEHRDYTEYYSRLSKSIVKNMWREDLDKFSYSFS